MKIELGLENSRLITEALEDYIGKMRHMKNIIIESSFVSKVPSVNEQMLSALNEKITKSQRIVDDLMILIKREQQIIDNQNDNK